MKILIIEDEIPASKQLIASINSLDSTIEVLDILESNEAVFNWFKGHEILPDLIFSDIELLDGVVFNSLLQLDVQVPIIFTTAYQQFTMEAFNSSGIAYLLKPVKPEALEQAINKYKSLTTTNADSLTALLANLDLSKKNDYKSRFTVKMSKGIYLLNASDISCMRMKNGVLHAFNHIGKSFILSLNLNDTYKQLNPADFFMVNRSEVVNIHFIEKVENYFNDRLAIIVGGQTEPIITSISKTPEFRKWLEG